MTIQEKIVLRLFLFCLILAPVLLGIHYAIFPEETKAILVDSQGYKEKGRIYYTDSTSETSVDNLQRLIDSAAARVAAFWGEQLSDPDYIYLENYDDYSGYCKTDAPAVTFLKLGSHIVLSADAANVDIIAHEISHAELYERIGFFKWTYSVPVWFKQGLAMMNDHRIAYSDDTLLALTKDNPDIIDIKNYETDGSFYYGTEEEVRLHYMLAKKEVSRWYTKENLSQLIDAMNNGESFYSAYMMGQDLSDTVPTADTIPQDVVEAAPVPVKEEPKKEVIKEKAPDEEEIPEEEEPYVP